MASKPETIVKRAKGKNHKPRQSRVAPIAPILFACGLILLSVFSVSYFGAGKSKTEAPPAKLKAQGEQLYAAGRYNRAARSLARYLKLVPDDKQTRELLSRIYWQIGDERRAFAELSAVNKSSSANGDRLYRLGLLAGQLKKKDEAVRHLRKAVDLKPNSLLFRVELAKELTKTKHYDEAVAQWQEAIYRLPEKDLYSAVIYAELGDTLRLKGDIEKAKEAYRRGLEIEPGNIYLQAQIADAGGQ